MNPTAAAYEAALRPLSVVVAAVHVDGAWDRPSPCAGWTGRDVVAHIVDTQRDLLVGHGHDLGPAPEMSDPARALRRHAEQVLRLVAQEAVVGATYDGFFGPTTVGSTLVQFYVWDMLVHRWDVARAVGGDEALDAEELDRIEVGADSFGDTLHADGICGPALPAPPGADRQARLLSRLGRDTSMPGTRR